MKRAKTISSKITKSDIGEMNAIKSPSFNDNNSPNEIEITDNINNETEKKEENKRKIIDKIEFSRVDKYLCFICLRKRKTMQNFLIDEGMRLVSQYLDVINLFKKSFRETLLIEKIKEENVIEMSDECKENVQKVYKSFYSL